MTPEQLAKKYTDIIQKLERGDMLAIAAFTSASETQQRIFDKGMGSEGNSLKEMSTKPIYINPENSPRGFQAEGKTGKKEFKSGKRKGQKYVTKYFSGGYKQYKQVIGRANKYLQNFGRLRSDMAAGLTALNPVNNSVEWGPKSQDNIDKILGLQRRKGAILSPTKQERELFTDTFRYEVNKIINA